MKTQFIFLFLLYSILGFSQEIKTLEAKQEKDAAFFDYEDHETSENGNLKPVGDLVFLKGCSGIAVVMLVL